MLEALLPYYGLSITTMQERMQDAEKVLETFTLIVQNGKVELQWNDNYSRDWWWSSRPRAEAQINLMEPFLQHLPNFRSVQLLSGYDLRSKVLQCNFHHPRSAFHSAGSY